MATAILVVGYSTVPNPLWKELAADTDFADMPEDEQALYAYSGLLDHVVIVDPQKETVFDTASPGKFKNESPALAVASWLMENYRTAWPADSHGYVPGGPAAAFYGFDMRRFLKMLGLECASCQQPLPVSLWYSNSDHRDMEGALLPNGAVHKKLGLQLALKAMGISAVDWQPYHDATADARIAVEIAAALGFLPAMRKKPKLPEKSRAKKKDD